MRDGGQISARVGFIDNVAQADVRCALRSETPMQVAGSEAVWALAESSISGWHNVN